MLAQAASQGKASGMQAAGQQASALLPLQYYQDVMPNILGAMGQRERALLTLLTIKNDIQVGGALLACLQNFAMCVHAVLSPWCCSRRAMSAAAGCLSPGTPPPALP